MGCVDDRGAWTDADCRACDSLAKIDLRVLRSKGTHRVQLLPDLKIDIS